MSKKESNNNDVIDYDDNKLKISSIARGTKRKPSNVQLLKQIEAKSCTLNPKPRQLRPSFNVMKKKKSSKKSLIDKFVDIQQQNQQLKKILKKVIILINQIDQGKKEILTDINLQNALYYLLKQRCSFLCKMSILTIKPRSNRWILIQNKFLEFLRKKNFLINKGKFNRIQWSQEENQCTLKCIQKNINMFNNIQQIYQHKDDLEMKKIDLNSTRNKYRGKNFQSTKSELNSSEMINLQLQYKQLSIIFELHIQV
ncbi:unnamed protein product [Paramecium sonneborni]|uniref:Uncharacterized protein n=1 Tax=Paramecium sonneborni TaxID=65129 RepID=A0A8S1RST8_9CILI|nr:unnamed protein product [Paramecium sonneborni]